MWPTSAVEFYNEATWFCDELQSRAEAENNSDANLRTDDTADPNHDTDTDMATDEPQARAEDENSSDTNLHAQDSADPDRDATMGVATDVSVDIPADPATGSSAMDVDVGDGHNVPPMAVGGAVDDTVDNIIGAHDGGLRGRTVDTGEKLADAGQQVQYANQLA